MRKKMQEDGENALKVWSEVMHRRNKTIISGMSHMAENSELTSKGLDEIFQTCFFAKYEVKMGRPYQLTIYCS